MDRGWLELESDPGLFTLLVEDFGVQGVQVEEIYDLQKSLEGPVYGFIFLFKWIEERRSRRKIIQEEESFVDDIDVVNRMFFAQQVIPNSCATHALLSVLLNCDKVKLGDMLTRIQEFTYNMSPEDKGYAILNMPELARAHNRHARPEPAPLPDKASGVSTVRTRDAFHFVSYVPVGGRLFELDGLKPCPIDHGPWGEHEEWTEKFRRVITERLGMATGGEPYHDIRFNLMAVVPDRRQLYSHKLETLKTNRRIVLETLQKLLDSQMVKVTGNSILDQQTDIKNKNKNPSVQGTQSSISLRTRTKRRAAAEAAACTTPPPVSNVGNVCTPRLPSALDSHNYAKSPIMERKDGDSNHDDLSDIEMKDEQEMKLESDKDSQNLKLNSLETHQLRTCKDDRVKIEIAMSEDKEGRVSIPTTVAKTDVTKPLIIQTKFASSSGESTDTASEVGSSLNSPVCSTASTQGSPNVMGICRPKPEIIHALTRLSKESEEKFVKQNGVTGTLEKKDKKEEVSPSSTLRSMSGRFANHQGFTPKDLLDLFNTVEHEITVCENNLRDEVEKRRKYKMDVSRRPHNYDQFLCTFLSMLAEQGQLAGLVEQHMLTKRRQGANIGHVHKITKPEKRKRSRPKKRR